MLSYAVVEGFLQEALTEVGYDPLPYFNPGPGTNLLISNLVPDEMVIITIGNGPGLDSEQVFDRAGVQIRSIGPQQDYAGAEKLAQDIDRAFVALDHTQNIQGLRVLTVWRTGGPPSLMLMDDGDRYHFTGNYIWEVVY